MKKEALIALLLALVLAACQQGTDKFDEDLSFRVDSLYEHTIIMIESSEPAVLDRICLDWRQIEFLYNMTPEDKISQMALAFNVTLSGNSESQVTLLEDKMGRMMDHWNEAQEEDALRRCY
jgi:hypothetical protein